MCFLPLAAAAVAAPRIPLRLLGRGLAAAMSTSEPLKSVDYEVFGRVQGRPFPRGLELPLGHDTAAAGGKEVKRACAGVLGRAQAPGFNSRTLSIKRHGELNPRAHTGALILGSAGSAGRGGGGGQEEASDDRRPRLPSLPGQARAYDSGGGQARKAPSGPMCFLPLAAAAVAAPRIPLRLLGRGLAAAMSTSEPLKSVDYEVFGRVQGRPFPRGLELPLGHDTAAAGGKEVKRACAGVLGRAQGGLKEPTKERGWSEGRLGT
ncbi:Hypothetical predicted protein [Marmota monax]|uniref:Uncharacterized protein n=1 Tax=Marmota monax TaxID=9995 RepID=A0A5E4CAZ7_MARMO|nr:Hypothetical predicted protein [Marmota monax]